VVYWAEVNGGCCSVSCSVFTVSRVVGLASVVEVYCSEGLSALGHLGSKSWIYLVMLITVLLSQVVIGTTAFNCAVTFQCVRLSGLSTGFLVK
jgi:hypothetical protein